jgi:Ca2+-dependent lipid-binding protein
MSSETPSTQPNLTASQENVESASTPKVESTAVTTAPPPTLTATQNRYPDLSKRGSPEEFPISMQSIPATVVGVVTSWLAGYFGFSFFFAVLLIIIWTATANILIQRYVRDKVCEEQAAKPKVYPTKESSEWLNEIIIKIWKNYSVFIAGMLKLKIEPAIQAQKPGFLVSWRFAVFFCFHGVLNLFL